jgi:flagellar basal body-associated protein FliL
MMMRKKEKKRAKRRLADQKKQAEVSSNSSSTATKVFFGIVLIALVCGGLFFIKKARATTPSPATTYTYNLGEVLTNLSDASDMRYVKTTITLETNNKAVENEIQNKEFQVRDCLISLFNSETSEDFLNDPAKVKDMAVDGLNKNLTSGRVTNIYFSDLVMQ